MEAWILLRLVSVSDAHLGEREAPWAMEGLIELQRTGVPDRGLESVPPAGIGILGISHFGPPAQGRLSWDSRVTMTGSWILGPGSWILGPGSWILDPGSFWVGAGPVPQANPSPSKCPPFQAPGALNWALVKKPKCAAGVCVFISIWTSGRRP